MKVQIEVLDKSSNWFELTSLLEGFSKKDLGDFFEQFCCYFLKWHPAYSSIYKNVWLHQDVPHEVRQFCNIPKLDGGLDAYALTFDGRYIGIQCKYQSNTSGSLSRNVFATSVDQAFSQCKNISGLVLMTTKEKLTKAAERYQVPVSGITLDSWLELEGETFEQFKAFIRGDMERSKPNPYNPRPHQSKALENAKKHFLRDGNSKGKLIHPCGAGKSLTGFWLAQELKARSIVVAVPSLTLIRQTYKTWLREFKAHGEEVDWIAVCSDKTVGKLSESEQDDVVTSLLELGIESHTDPDFLSNWLRPQNGRKKIVFTTYQSGLALSEGVKRAGFTFDLGIFDEAHKTVGQSAKLFSHLLFDENIPVRKRIFMTATERVYRGNSDEILSMDDPNVYGKTFEFFSFKEAIESNPPVLTDYKVLGLIITKEEIRNFISSNTLLRTKGLNWTEDVEASMVASLIALNKAYEKYGIKHTVSFHSTIARAAAFKENQIKLNQIGLFPRISTYHVTGKTSSAERNKEIRAFALADRSLITNSRYLTEGVDVPNIDCVLFADPKKSKIDIVQAIGRALRISKEKVTGFILLPIIFDSNQEDIENGSFKEVLNVLRSLALEDSRIIDEIKFLSMNDYAQRTNLIELQSDSREVTSIQMSNLIETIFLKTWSRLRGLSWRNFEDSRNFVRGLGLQSVKEWEDFAKNTGNKEGQRPLDIPYWPSEVYLEDWLSWGDWLGTGTIAPFNRKYMDYELAKKFVHSLKLSSGAEWRKYCQSGKKPENIPANPLGHYGESFKSMGDWLGTKYVATRLRNYIDFLDARRWVHQLGLNNQNEWKDYKKINKLPKNIPQSPQDTYAKKGWVSWADFLGSSSISTKDRKYLPFEKARAYVHQLKLKSQNEWNDYIKSGNLPPNIPKTPRHIYKQLGWISFGDWLGTNEVATFKRVYLPFETARTNVRQLNLKSRSEFNSMRRTGVLGPEFHSTPNRYYKNKGWISWDNWLNKE